MLADTTRSKMDKQYCEEPCRYCSKQRLCFFILESDFTCLCIECINAGFAVQDTSVSRVNNRIRQSSITAYMIPQNIEESEEGELYCQNCHIDKPRVIVTCDDEIHGQTVCQPCLNAIAAHAVSDEYDKWAVTYPICDSDDEE